jgi:hypothetical protein
VRARFALIGIIGLVTLATLAAVAQDAAVSDQRPRYDTATEFTLSGTVQEVREVTGGKGRGGRGTHLIVKGEKETFTVHVGPSSFLAEKKLTLATGDVVDIIGSRVKVADAEVVIAREIRKGTQTVVLRDAKGIPLWSGGRGR